MKPMNLILVAAVAAAAMLMLSGCTTTSETLSRVNDASLKAEETIQAVNDRELDIGYKLTCGGGLEAIRRKFGDDPQALQSLLVLCGWSATNKAAIMSTVTWTK